jgi:hypothetical protein
MSVVQQPLLYPLKVAMRIGLRYLLSVWLGWCLAAVLCIVAVQHNASVCVHQQCAGSHQLPADLGYDLQ